MEGHVPIPEFEVPAEHLTAFQKMAAMDGKAFDRLMDALKSSPPVSSLSAYADSVAKAAGLERAAAQTIVKVLANVYNTAGVFNEPLPETTKTLIAALKLDDAHAPLREELGRRVAAAMNLHSTLGAVSKARSLKYEFERHYVTSRVLTDLRPVFSERPDRQLVAAVVTHELKLAVHENEETREIYVSLTSENLKDLKSRIEDAQEKERLVLGFAAGKLQVMD